MIASVSGTAVIGTISSLATLLVVFGSSYGRRAVARMVKGQTAEQVASFAADQIAASKDAYEIQVAENARLNAALREEREHNKTLTEALRLMGRNPS
jgi:hypothetical protein